MKFIDSVDMNLSSHIVKVPAGSYEALNFRFSGTNEAAQTITATDLGSIELRYRGKVRQRVKFSELQVYNGKKGGTFETSSAVGGAFAFSFVLPFNHPQDDENVFWVQDDQVARLEWQPDSGLAAKVVAASIMRVHGIEKQGVMKYLLGFNRVDIAMVAGSTRPEVLTPYNVASLFCEYNTNIDQLDIDVDGQPFVTNAEIVELLNFDLYKNRIETYAASGYAEVDLVKSRKTIEALNNEVRVRLVGSLADTISLFWTYLDFMPTELQKTILLNSQETDAILARKVASGGAGAVAVNSFTKG